MPAPLPVNPRERFAALAAVALVQIGLGAALLFGLRVDALRHNELVSRLIEVGLVPPPPPVVPVRVRPAAAPLFRSPEGRAQADWRIAGPHPVPRLSESDADRGACPICANRGRG